MSRPRSVLQTAPFTCLLKIAPTADWDIKTYENYFKLGNVDIGNACFSEWGSHCLRRTEEVCYVIWKQTNKAALSETNRVWGTWKDQWPVTETFLSLQLHLYFLKASLEVESFARLVCLTALVNTKPALITCLNRSTFLKAAQTQTGCKTKKEMSATYTQCKLELEWRPLIKAPSGVITGGGHAVRALRPNIYTVD